MCAHHANAARATTLRQEVDDKMDDDERGAMIACGALVEELHPKCKPESNIMRYRYTQECGSEMKEIARGMQKENTAIGDEASGI
jgi:hypothetical protein